MMSNLEHVKEYLMSLQNRICAALEDIDGEAKFAHDAWDRPGGGGGESRVMKGGRVFEQAGVNFSHVFGKQMPPSATKNRPELAGKSAGPKAVITQIINHYRILPGILIRFFKFIIRNIMMFFNVME